RPSQSRIIGRLPDARHGEQREARVVTTSEPLQDGATGTGVRGGERRSGEATRPTPLVRGDFRHFLPITTRWMDNDVYGHVNNVVYYSYFDTVVNRYLIERGVLDIRSEERRVGKECRSGWSSRHGDQKDEWCD